MESIMCKKYYVLAIFLILSLLVQVQGDYDEEDFGFKRHDTKFPPMLGKRAQMRVFSLGKRAGGGDGPMRVFSLGCSGSYAANIYEDLFADYNKNVRPVKNDSQTVFVKIVPVLFGIVALDEVRETVELNYWFVRNWVDDYLQWNISDYGGVKSIQVPVEKLWLPDLIVYGMFEQRNDPSNELTLATLNYDGRIRVSTNQFLTTSCQFDIAPFPFDEQNCTLRFGSWSYHGLQLDVFTENGTGADLSQYNDNTEWQLLSFSSTKAVLYFNNLTYPELHFTLAIARRPEYYLLTQVVPTAIITALAFVGLFSPFDATGNRQEKVTMGLTTLLTMSVVLTVVSSQMPKTSHGLPFIGIYILQELTLAAVGSFCTVGVMYLNKTALYGHKCPRWLLIITRLPPHFGEKLPKVDDALSMLTTTMGRHTVEQTNVQGIETETRYQMLKCAGDISKIRQLMEDKDLEERRLLAWGVACQRLDMLLMVVFQSANIFLTFNVFYDSALVNALNSLF